MPLLSARAFADAIGISHTSINNAIQTLEAEGETIGIRNGEGKSRDLSELDQQLILSQLSPKLRAKALENLDLAGVTTPPDSTIEEFQTNGAITPYSAKGLTLRVGKSSTAARLMRVNSTQTLNDLQGNTDLIESAFLQHAKASGTSLGAKYMGVKIGAFAEEVDRAQTEFAIETGLIQTDEPSAPQDLINE